MVTNLIRLVILVGMSFGLLATTFAQSPYSGFGVGIINPGGLEQNQALGNSGFGLRSPLFVNSLNPAAYTAIQQPISLILNAGLFAQQTWQEGNTQQDWVGDGGLAHLTLWFRPTPWWAASLGIAPFSSMRYRLESTRNNPELAGDYTVLYEGTGGLNEVFFGSGFDLFRYFSLGVQGSYIYGTLNQTEAFTSNNAVAGFDLETETFLHQFKIDFGVQYAIPIANSRLVIGATYQPSFQMGGSESILLNSGIQTLEEESGLSSTYYLPTTAGGGLSLEMGRWLFTGDVQFQQWEEASGFEEVEPQNTFRLAGGVEYRLGGDVTTRQKNPLYLRTGFSHQNFYLAFDGASFNEWTWTTGVAIPMSRGQHHISINYTLGRRGVVQGDLIRETIHQIGLHLSLRDVFLKRRYE